MKKLLALTLLIPSLALAETTQKVDIPVTTNNTTDARNMSTSNSTGSDLSRAVGMAVAPALTSSFSETCLGSTSFSAGFAGGAFSGGTTHVDADCVRRLNAREIRALGDGIVAKEVLCGNDDVRAAFKLAGRPCLIDGGIDPIKNTQVIVNNNSKQRQDELYNAAILRLNEQKTIK